MLTRHTRKIFSNSLLHCNSAAFYRRHSTTAEMLELATPLLYSYWGGQFVLPVTSHKSFDILSTILQSNSTTEKPSKEKFIRCEDRYYCSLVEYYAAQQDLAAAFSTAEEFIQEMAKYKDSDLFMYSSTPRAYRYLGLLYLESKQHDQAINCFEKAVELRIKLKRDSITEKIDVAIAHIFIGELEQATKEIDKTIRTMITRSIDYTDVLSLRGICNALRGQAYYEIANNDFDNACSVIKKTWPKQTQHVLRYDQLCIHTLLNSENHAKTDVIKERAELEKLAGYFGVNLNNAPPPMAIQTAISS